MGNLKSTPRKSYVAVNNFSPPATYLHYSKKSSITWAEKCNGSVVLVCCCDEMGNVFELCTGFFADGNKGLLVTASHAIYDLKKTYKVKKIRPSSNWKNYEKT